MLARVHVEHEVGQRPLQPGAHAQVHGEPRARDLGGALEIQNAQRRAQIPVRLGFEIELARLAPAADFQVVGGAAPTGTLSCGTLGTWRNTSRRRWSQAFACSSSS